MNAQLNKIISILFILSALSGFIGFEHVRKSLSPVREILSPVEIKVNDSIVCVPNLKAFTSDLSKPQTELIKQYNLSYEDAIKLGYLTDIFVEDFLSNKRVKVKYTGERNPNCVYGDIYVNNTSYSKALINAGFGIYNGELPQNFENQLKKAKAQKLVILNHKSNKYHKLDCKYGQIASDSVILPKRHLPADTKPCKFCHLDKNSVYSANLHKTYPLVISDGTLKMFLSDSTIKLKPDDKCSSLACQEILNQINSAQKSIDIALYGWDNIPELYTAITKAKARGVKLQVVSDKSFNNYYPEIEILNRLADKKSADSPKKLMHNKFIIFDKKVVITGSMNFAKTGLSGFNTNCVFSITSQELAEQYYQEFSQMLDGKFGTNKTPINHKTIQLKDIKITPLFSPKDKVITNNVIPLISSAKNYIYMPIFIITHNELTQELINAAKRGVEVKVIIDATSTKAAKNKIKTLRDSGIPVKIENYAGKVHSKSIIIDDKYIIAGSMNFTNSGENKNDENCLIIENERLAKYYKGFFEYFWSKIPDKHLNGYVKPEGKDSIGSCFDGIDNNYNGKIDMQDDSCKALIVK